MAEFNFHNSRVEQVNDTGDNIKVENKIEGNTAPVAVSGMGPVAQAVGEDNTVNAEKPSPGIWEKISKVWNAIKSWWTGGAT